MALVFLGAIVVGAAYLAGRRFWHDGLRLTIVGSWLAMLAITVLFGFYIELHEDQFGGAQQANDAAFASAHPMTGIFLMMALSLALLLVDVYRVEGLARRLAIATGATGLIAAVVGTTWWTFVDPSNNGVAYGLYVAGIVISYLAIFLAAITIRAVRPRSVTMTPPPVEAPSPS
jgi:hypothetical protein